MAASWKLLICAIILLFTICAFAEDTFEPQRQGGVLDGTEIDDDGEGRGSYPDNNQNTANYHESGGRHNPEGLQGGDETDIESDENDLQGDRSTRDDSVNGPGEGIDPTELEGDMERIEEPVPVTEKSESTDGISSSASDENNKESAQRQSEENIEVPRTVESGLNVAESPGEVPTLPVEDQSRENIIREPEIPLQEKEMAENAGDKRHSEITVDESAEIKSLDAKREDITNEMWEKLKASESTEGVVPVESVLKDERRDESSNEDLVRQKENEPEEKSDAQEEKRPSHHDHEMESKETHTVEGQSAHSESVVLETQTAPNVPVEGGGLNVPVEGGAPSVPVEEGTPIVPAEGPPIVPVGVDFGAEEQIKADYVNASDELVKQNEDSRTSEASVVDLKELPASVAEDASMAKESPELNDTRDSPREEQLTVEVKEDAGNAADHAHSLDGKITGEKDGQQHFEWHRLHSGIGLRSLLSEQEPEVEHVHSSSEEEKAEHPVETEKVQDSTESEKEQSLSEGNTEVLDNDLIQEPEKEEAAGEHHEHGEDFAEIKSPHQDSPKSESTIFTLKPYVIIAEHALSHLDPTLEKLIDSMPPELQKLFLRAPFTFTPARNLLLFVSSLLSLFIITSYGCCRRSKQKSELSKKQALIEQLSTVQGNLLISEQEKEAVLSQLERLEAELKAFQDRSNLTQDEAGELSSRVDRLSKENETLQQKTSDQQDKITDLSKTVASHLKSFNSEAEKNKSIQKKLDDTTAHANLLEKQLYELQTTLQESQGSALEMQSQLQSMMEEISILQTSKDQLLLEAEGWNEKVQEQAEQISKQQEQEKSFQEAISRRDTEISVLRDSFQQLTLFETSFQSTDPTNGEAGDEEGDDEERKKRIKEEIQAKIKSMIDVAQINAKLNAAEEEKNSLRHSLSVEMENRLELEDQVKQMKAEMETLTESRHEAEQQASHTALKMDVLVNYFKEKETELNRKLGEQEAREKASADQLMNTDEKTKEFEKMVHLYKEQVEDLQKEIKNIEADYKKQISLQEKKAHENWLVARQSERGVKEFKAEAQLLRHKIIELQSKLDAATSETKGTPETAQAVPGLGVTNGNLSMLPVEDRPMSRPLLQGPGFGPPHPPFGPGPFLPIDRPLPPPMFGPPMPPPPPMMFDRLPGMRSPPPFDMWPPPSHMRRSPRDRTPPRIRSPSPVRRGSSPSSQRSRMSPTSLRGGRYSPPPRNESPPPAMGDRRSPYVPGPRVPHPGNVRPPRNTHGRPGPDNRSGPRP